MKYISIVLFLFFIQVSASVVNSLGFYSSQVQPQTDWYDVIDSDQLKTEEYIQGNVAASADYNFGVGDFIKGLWYFIKAVGLGIISIPYTLRQFGMQSPLVYYFSLPVYMLYFIAVAQFIANRGLKSMR